MLQVPTLFYTLVERPQQPHEKHGNTSLSQELNRELRCSSHGLGQIGVFTVRTTPPVHKVSYELTHDSTPFSSELEKGGYIARKACASTSYFYNLFTYNGGNQRRLSAVRWSDLLSEVKTANVNNPANFLIQRDYLQLFLNKS